VAVDFGIGEKSGFVQPTYLGFGSSGSMTGTDPTDELRACLYHVREAKEYCQILTAPVFSFLLQPVFLRISCSIVLYGCWFTWILL
jgi:hypothetical protein